MSSYAFGSPLIQQGTPPAPVFASTATFPNLVGNTNLLPNPSISGAPYVGPWVPYTGTGQTSGSGGLLGSLYHGFAQYAPDNYVLRQLWNTPPVQSFFKNTPAGRAIAGGVHGVGSGL